MSKETRQDIKFYTLVVMGFSLLVMGFWVYPPGSITSSVLVAAGILFSLAGLLQGVDLEGIIRELRLLKNESINDIKQEAKEDEKD